VPGEAAAPVAPAPRPDLDAVHFTLGRDGTVATSPAAGAPAWHGAAEAAPAVRHSAEATAATQSGPNLMLAIVCWVASATSLFEAWAFYAKGWWNTYAFSGYLTLGLGILLFSVEAVFWSRRPRPLWMNVLFGIGIVLALVGVVYLKLTHDPGRRI
jgi:hypothetical protein